MVDVLDRFVTAQANTYDLALAELRAGDKQSHWMWFVFPQIAGLGRSAIARGFAIRDLAEARTYLAHPVIGPRLVEAATVLLGWAGKRGAESMLGDIDAMKLRSSMTLFRSAGGDPVFDRVIDEFFDGEADAKTLALISGRT